ncbi:Pentatricopeptide repeat-containing protein [Platanthera zijinensis]|uniref:Pentatricopeptide repeat-containing protein n=1 Tax=Platanthera zijinensis TaxID=2320716 RepID=A0AAP0GEY0_9ASPA
MAKLGLAAVRPIFLQEWRSVALSWLNPSSFQSSSSLVLRIEAARCTIDKPPRSHSKSGKKEHHLWMKRDSAGSGQKALHLVRLVSKLPDDKDAVTAALDYWTAWETEFPVIASAKALEILRRRNQWRRIIQVSKWLLSKGQVLTMGTYDTLLLALDRDGRLDEAEELWRMILQTNTRSVSKRLFSRMVSIYDRRRVSEKVVEVFADMEELGVRPDDDTVRRVASAFANLGEFENQKLVLRKYQNKWKYLRFNGERRWELFAGAPGIDSCRRYARRNLWTFDKTSGSTSDFASFSTTSHLRSYKDDLAAAHDAQVAEDSPSFIRRSSCIRVYVLKVTRHTQTSRDRGT